MFSHSNITANIYVTLFNNNVFINRISNSCYKILNIGLEKNSFFIFLILNKFGIKTFGMSRSLDNAKNTLSKTPASIISCFSSEYKSTDFVLHPKNNQTLGNCKKIVIFRKQKIILKKPIKLTTTSGFSSFK